PLSFDTNRGLAMTLYWAGRYDEAADCLKKALALEPRSSELYDDLANVDARRGRFAEAIDEKRKSLSLSGDDEAAAVFGEERSEPAWRRGMRQLLEEHLAALQEQAKTEPVSPMAFAYVYSQLGDRDHAIEWLRKADEGGAPWMIAIAADPTFDLVRDDP